MKATFREVENREMGRRDVWSALCRLYKRLYVLKGRERERERERDVWSTLGLRDYLHGEREKEREEGKRGGGG